MNTLTEEQLKELKVLADDLQWESDRMSSSGVETLDKIMILLGGTA